MNMGQLFYNILNWVKHEFLSGSLRTSKTVSIIDKENLMFDQSFFTP